MSGFESPHATLSDPRWLMRKLRSIVCVLRGVMDCIWDEDAVSDTVTSQLVRDDASGFTATHPEQSLEEAHSCLSISATL